MMKRDTLKGKYKNQHKLALVYFLIPQSMDFKRDSLRASLMPHTANVTSNPCRIDTLKLKIPNKRA
jgi:hypothetical protein